MSKVIGVYMIEHVASGRRYVGKSVDVAARMRDHFARRGRGHLALAIAKYGRAAFTWSLLESCPDDAIACEREVYWIATLGTRSPHGFNLTDGGDGLAGHRHSEASRAVMSARATGRRKSPETREKMSRSATGRLMSEEAKRKVSLSRQNMSEETRARMRASALSRAARSPHG